MNPLSDEKIRHSWGRNAAAWTSAVREREIESRRRVTDAAIVDAVFSQSPGSVLDLGCGEGWLARELGARGVRVTGIDVVPELVDAARESGGGEFLVASYEDVISGAEIPRVDSVVCNFSLLGRESVEGLCTAVHRLLNEGGTLIIQTPHPVAACGDEPYRDGWRKGSWAGFSSRFVDPAPWYFRTLESWVRLFETSSLRLKEMREPTYPESGTLASVIFITEPRT